MAWWMIPLAMGGLGALQGSAKRKQEVENNKLQAELSKYAPWTGQWGQVSPIQNSAMNGFMQGGMSGLGLAQNMIGAKMIDGPKAAQNLDIPSTTEVSSGWASVGDMNSRDEALTRELRKRELRRDW